MLAQSVLPLTLRRFAFARVAVPLPVNGARGKTHLLPSAMASGLRRSKSPFGGFSCATRNTPQRHAPDFRPVWPFPLTAGRSSREAGRKALPHSILKTRRNLAPRRCFHRRLRRAGLDAMKRLTGLTACEARTLPINSVNRATVARPTRTPPPSLISGSRPGSRKGSDRIIAR